MLDWPDVTVQFDVPAPMRDGVILRADVYRRQGAEPTPTLLLRTPYGKRTLAELAWVGLDPVRAAAAGLMVVIQDTRGRFASDGIWDPFRYEQADGYDSVEWAASLPGASGRVGMLGGSYDGNAQLLAAIAQPPSLVAISPMMTWSEPTDGLLARGGAIELGLDLPWSLLCALHQVERGQDGLNPPRPELDDILDDWDALGDTGYWQLPVQGTHAVRRHAIPTLGSSSDSAQMASWCRIAGNHHRIQVPSLHTAGWYDGFLQGALDNYQALAALGRDARLVVGPWTHEQFADPIGQQLFGIRAARDGVAVHVAGNWNDLRLAWLRRYLQPSARAELPAEPVHIFVMGRNEWREEPCWPPADAVDERWFLQPRGGLSQVPPLDDVPESESTFASDPANPVPTLGGNTMLWAGYPAGPADQTEIEDRHDVLVFTSDVLGEDVEVTGRVRAVLHAQSSASASDWVARLCDVHPDGRSFNLCDGIVRVESHADQAACIEIDLWSTSNVFLQGHRLRVHIAGSSFPRWDRNLNTGDQQSAQHLVANQRILHDARHSSCVVLPTVRR